MGKLVTGAKGQLYKWGNLCSWLNLWHKKQHLLLGKANKLVGGAAFTMLIIICGQYHTVH